MVAYSETQKIFLAILPKIASALSMAGSTAILVECFHYNRSRLHIVHHRILCLMAIFDLIESPWNFVSTWAMPAESEEKFTAGSEVSCTVQASFLQTGVSVVILNAFLSWYYLLVIRYSWTEEKIKAKAEPWIYGTTLLFSLGTAIAGIPLNLYHPAGLWCWVGSDADPVTDSTNNYLFYRVLFYYGPLLLSSLVIIINTAILVWTVRQIEGKSKKYKKKSFEKRALGGRKGNASGDGGRRHFRKKSNGKKTKDAAEDGREKRMAELKRKLAEVQKIRSNRNASCVNISSSKGGGNTNTVMQLRAKKKQQFVMKKVEDQAQAESTSDNTKKLHANAFEGNATGATEVSSQPLKKLDTFMGTKRQGKATKSKTSIVAEQSFYYVLAFFLTYIWSIISRFLIAVNGESPFFFTVCQSFFDPMQGLFNYFVYIRPQFLAHRRKFPSLSIRQCVVSLITHKNRQSLEESVARLEYGATEETRKWKLGSAGGGAVKNEHESEANEDDKMSIIVEDNIIEEKNEEEEYNIGLSPLERLSLVDFPIAQDGGLDTVTNEEEPSGPRILTSIPEISYIEDRNYEEENIEEDNNIASSPLEPTSLDFPISKDAGLDTV